MNKFNKEYYWFLGSLFITVIAGYATMLVDASVGGRYIGEEAVSAINLLTPVNEVFYAIAILLGSGANTVAAMALGRGEILGVRKHFTAAIVSATVVLGALMGIVLCVREPLSQILTGNGQLYGPTLQYLSALVVFSMSEGVFAIIKMFTSMTGRPRLVMVSALCQLGANIFFDLLFVKELSLGIRGLALSSIISVFIGMAILIPNVLRGDCPFRPIRMKGSDFFKTAGVNARYGSGFLAGELTYIVFYFLMNTLVLRFQGEDGMFRWSVVMMIYLVGWYAVTSAQETCISLGGRYLGASDDASVNKIYRRSMIFSILWITAVMGVVIIFPDDVLPFFGANSPEAVAKATPAILCAIPFIFSSIAFLPLIRLIQRGRILRFTVCYVILYLSVPLLFFAAHFLAPANEWPGLLALPLVYVAVIALAGRK